MGRRKRKVKSEPLSETDKIIREIRGKAYDNFSKQVGRDREADIAYIQTFKDTLVETLNGIQTQLKEHLPAEILALLRIKEFTLNYRVQEFNRLLQVMRMEELIPSTEDIFEELVMSQGFASADEFNAMVMSIDLTKVDNLAKFKSWQINDGTKEGLLKLFGTLEDKNE